MINLKSRKYKGKENERKQLFYPVFPTIIEIRTYNVSSFFIPLVQYLKDYFIE